MTGSPWGLPVMLSSRAHPLSPAFALDLCLLGLSISRLQFECTPSHTGLCLDIGPQVGFHGMQLALHDSSNAAWCRLGPPKKAKQGRSSLHLAELEEESQWLCGASPAFMVTMLITASDLLAALASGATVLARVQGSGSTATLDELPEHESRSKICAPRQMQKREHSRAACQGAGCAVPVWQVPLTSMVLYFSP